MIAAKVVLLFVFVAGTSSSPAYQSVSLQDDGTYQFFYETDKSSGSHSRSESRGLDGVVVGKYSYEDPRGDLRVVNYRADDDGYVANGDVGVAGAPQSQFPAEVDAGQPDSAEAVVPMGGEEAKGSEEPVPQEDGKSDEEEGPKTEAPSPDAEEDYDEVKSMKLQETSYDSPPDGFPVGFFGQNFQGLRRLQEPTTEEPEDATKSEAAKIEEAKTEEPKTEEPKTEDKESSTTKPDDPKPPEHRYIPPIIPYSNFGPHAFPEPLSHASAEHKPVYVYSYHHPEAHGYYYFY